MGMSNYASNFNTCQLIELKLISEFGGLTGQGRVRDSEVETFVLLMGKINSLKWVFHKLD